MGPGKESCLRPAAWSRSVSEAPEGAVCGTLVRGPRRRAESLACAGRGRGRARPARACPRRGPGGRGRWSCPELGKPWLPGQQRGGDAPAAAPLKAAALGARVGPRLGAPAAAGRELSRASLTLVTRAVDAEPGRRPARQLVALPASSAFHARFSAGPAVSHVSGELVFPFFLSATVFSGQGTQAFLPLPPFWRLRGRGRAGGAGRGAGADRAAGS